MHKDCIFCKIIDKEMDGVMLFEDQDFCVILDKFPATKGHALVLPKQHAKNLMELPEGICEKAFVLAQKVACAMQAEFNPDGINIIQNNGLAAGQSVFHFHIHVLPRYEGDSVRIQQSGTQASDEILLEIQRKLAHKIR